MQSIAVSLIIVYQRRISPHKGYRCAHHAFYGGHTCSECAKQAVISKGLIGALPLIWKQLRECRLAYTRLQEMPFQLADAVGHRDESNSEKKQGDTCANICTLPCL